MITDLLMARKVILKLISLASREQPLSLHWDGGVLVMTVQGVKHEFLAAYNGPAIIEVLYQAFCQPRHRCQPKRTA
jgi:hypothetical protein